jgi:hypothetical protein
MYSCVYLVYRIGCKLAIGSLDLQLVYMYILLQKHDDSVS